MTNNEVKSTTKGNGSTSVNFFSQKEQEQGKQEAQKNKGVQFVELALDSINNYFLPCYQTMQDNPCIKSIIDNLTARALPEPPTIGLKNADSYFPEFNNFYDFFCTCYKDFICFGEILIVFNKGKFFHINPEAIIAIENNKACFLGEKKARYLISKQYIYVSNRGKNRGIGGLNNAYSLIKKLNEYEAVSDKANKISSIIIGSAETVNNSASLGEEEEKEEQKTQTTKESITLLETNFNKVTYWKQSPKDQETIKNDLVNRICNCFDADHVSIFGNLKGVTERTYKTYYDQQNLKIEHDLKRYLKPVLKQICIFLDLPTNNIKFADLNPHNALLKARAELTQDKVNKNRQELKNQKQVKQ